MSGEIYWREQSAYWKKQAEAMMDIRSGLRQDIEDLKFHIKIAEAKGYLDGYKEGSKAGIQFAIDANNVKPAPSIIISNVKAPRGDSYEWISAEEAGHRLKAQWETIMTLMGGAQTAQAGASRTSENSTGNQERQYDNSDPWTREGGIDQQ